MAAADACMSTIFTHGIPEQQCGVVEDASMVVVFTIFNLAGLILYLTKIILYVNYDGSRCNSSIVAQA